MSARRLLNIVYGLIIEGSSEEEREQFIASMNPARPSLKAISAAGGEIL